MTIESLIAMETNVPIDLVPLVPGYLKRREEEIEILMRHLEANDYDGIYLVAHKLTGNGTGYGMPAISEIGKSLGVAAKANNSPMARECIIQLREVVHHLKNELIKSAA